MSSDPIKISGEKQPGPPGKPPGVKPMRRWRWTVLLGLVLLGIGLLGFWMTRHGSISDDAIPLTAPVEVGSFTEEVVEPGEIESSRSTEVRCEVQSRSLNGSLILEIAMEGTYVQKGDLLARLDDSTLQSDYLLQQIVVNNSQASLIQAQADVEAAKGALKEYENNLFRQEEDMMESAEFVARESVRRAEEYLRYSQRMAARGYISDVQLEADRFSVEKARKDLEAAQAKLQILRSYTKQRNLSKMQVDVETAAARMRSRENTYKLDTMRLEQIKDQINKCVIRAPANGQVVYANDVRLRTATTDVAIGEGRTVRERQIMFRLPDPKRMRVVAKINEARINRVKANMKARIKVDAFPDEAHDGRVSKVGEYPLPPTSTLTAHIKEYATEVEILNPPPGLRSGMTAEVAIQVAQFENALHVPLPAVFERKSRMFCLVQNNPLSMEAREVKVGAVNDKFVVIRQGLHSNDLVVLNPGRFENDITYPAAPVVAPVPPAPKVAKGTAPTAKKAGALSKAAITKKTTNSVVNSP